MRAARLLVRAARSLPATQQRGIAFKQLTPGSRPTVAGVAVTVFGATGFLGRYVVNQIGKTGSQVIVPYRGDELQYRHLKLNGDLGQIVPVPFHPLNPETIHYALERSAIVVNLIGRRYKTRNYSYEDVNVKIPQTIARIAKEAGVQRFVHVSALGADFDSPSEWGRTKARGEDLVREEFPEATILRPAPIFGHEDKLVMNHAAFAKTFSVMPIIGGDARIQPTWVVDVAQAVLNAVRDGESAGKVYELTGPREYTRDELLRQVVQIAGLWRTNPVRIPALLAAIPGIAGDLVPMFEPMITRDIVHQYTQDAVRSEDALGYEALGIKPDTFEKHAVSLLRKFRPPRATIGFEITEGVEEAKTWPDDLDKREMALGAFKRLNIREELRRIQ